MQDLVDGQSGFITHSGLHAGGDPIYDGRQEQSGLLLTFRQIEFGPQGDGLHESIFGSGCSAKIYRYLFKVMFFIV